MRRKCEKKVTECQLDKVKTFEKQLELNLSQDQRAYDESLFVDGNFSKLQKYFKIIRKTDTIPDEVYLDDQRATSNLVIPICLINNFSQFLATPSR